MEDRIFVPHDSPTAAPQIADALRRFISANREIVFVCIGSDRVNGDSVGPFTGTFLQEAGGPTVYGTLDDPVHAQNLAERMNWIKRAHPRATIIAVDAMLGRAELVGNVAVVRGPLLPGVGAGKDLGMVGDFGVAPVVAVQDFAYMFMLQSTRLSLIVRMARQIVAGVRMWLDQPYAQVAASEE